MLKNIFNLSFSYFYFLFLNFVSPPALLAVTLFPLSLTSHLEKSVYTLSLQDHKINGKVKIISQEKKINLGPDFEGLVTHQRSSYLAYFNHLTGKPVNISILSRYMELNN